MSALFDSMTRLVAPAAGQRRRRSGLLAFLMVGGSGALGFVVLSSLLIWLHTGLADWVVNTLSYGVLIGPVYLLHHRFSFRSDAAHAHAVPRYFALQGMALLLAAGFSFGVHRFLGLPPVPASIVVIGLTASVNYLVLRRWAFGPARLEAVAPA